MVSDRPDRGRRERKGPEGNTTEPAKFGARLLGDRGRPVTAVTFSVSPVLVIDLRFLARA